MDLDNENPNGAMEASCSVAACNQSENNIDWVPAENSPQKRQPMKLVNLESDDEDVEMVDKFILDRHGDRSSSGSGTSDSDQDTSSSSDEQEVVKRTTKKKTDSSGSSSDSSSEEEEEDKDKKVYEKTVANKKTDSSGSSSDTSIEKEEEGKKTAVDANSMNEDEKSLADTAGRVTTAETSPCSAPKPGSPVNEEFLSAQASPEEGIEDDSRLVRQTSLVSYECSSSSEEEEEEEGRQMETERSMVPAGNPAAIIVPIKAPGELTVEDLPPIEILSLEVSEGTELRLIGRVSSIVNSLIVIQCLPGAPGLDDDSLLFREDRTSIGKVFELFGPVIAPFCSIRFNSAAEATNSGVEVGMPVFFAPQRSDLSRIVLPARLDNKGSDASWKNDDEPPSQFLDYSDDETERREKRKTRGRPTEEAAGEEAGPSDAAARPRSAPKRRDRRSRPEQPPSWRWPPQAPTAPATGHWAPPPAPHGLPRWPVPPIDLSVPPPGWSGPPLPTGQVPHVGNPTDNRLGNPTGNQFGNSTGSQFGNPTENRPGNPTGNQFANSTGSQFGNPPGHQIGPVPASNVPPPSSDTAHPSGTGFDHYFDHYYRYYQQYYQQYYQSAPQNP